MDTLTILSATVVAVCAAQITVMWYMCIVRRVGIAEAGLVLHTQLALYVSKLVLGPAAATQFMQTSSVPAAAVSSVVNVAALLSLDLWRLMEWAIVAPAIVQLIVSLQARVEEHQRAPGLTWRMPASLLSRVGSSLASVTIACGVLSCTSVSSASVATPAQALLFCLACISALGVLTIVTISLYSSACFGPFQCSHYLLILWIGFTASWAAYPILALISPSGIGRIGDETLHVPFAVVDLVAVNAVVAAVYAIRFAMFDASSSVWVQLASNTGTQTEGTAEVCKAVEVMADAAVSALSEQPPVKPATPVRPIRQVTELDVKEHVVVELNDSPASPKRDVLSIPQPVTPAAREASRSGSPERHLSSQSLEPPPQLAVTSPAPPPASASLGLPPARARSQTHEAEEAEITAIRGEMLEVAHARAAKARATPTFARMALPFSVGDLFSDAELKEWSRRLNAAMEKREGAPAPVTARELAPTRRVLPLLSGAGIGRAGYDPSLPVHQRLYGDAIARNVRLDDLLRQARAAYEREMTAGAEAPAAMGGSLSARSEVSRSIGGPSSGISSPSPSRVRTSPRLDAMPVMPASVAGDAAPSRRQL